jgi:hypothetical protein
MLIIVIVFVVSCFFMYGSGGRRSIAATQPQSGEGEVIQDRAVVVVNGERILLSRLELEVAQFIRAMGLEASATSVDYPAFRNTVVDRMATLKELDNEIVTRKVTASKEEIDAAINEIEAQFPTKEMYLQQLQQSGITEAELRKSVEENLKRSKVLDEVTVAVSTDETELRNFYEMMKTYAFQKPDGFLMDIAHFGTEDAANAARDEISAGKNWDDVVTAVSADAIDYSTTDNRMFIPSDQLTGEVEFLKELSMDVPSKVINFTSEDHMIVVKRTHEEAGAATFDEVSADIEQMLVGQKRTALQSQFMQELRARANVDILDKDLFTVLSQDVAEETSGDVLSGDAVIVTEETPEVVAEVPVTSEDEIVVIEEGPVPRETTAQPEATTQSETTTTEPEKTVAQPEEATTTQPEETATPPAVTSGD